MTNKSGFASAIPFFAIPLLVVLLASSASAVPEFKDAFQAKYIKPDSSEANDVALARAFKRANCNVCHAGNNKRIRNDYGKELAKLLKRGDGRNKKKIDAAFDTIAKVKSNPADPNSPTFGEKIASGKLPVMLANAGPADGFGPPGPPRDFGPGGRRPPRREGLPNESGDPQFGPGPGGPPGGPDSFGPGQPSGPPPDGPPDQPGSSGPGQPPDQLPPGPRSDGSAPGDSEIAKLIEAANDLDRRARDVVRRYRDAPKEEQAKLKAELEKLVTEQFDTWHQRRKLEMAHLEEELNRIRAATESRIKEKQQMIQRRISDLLGEKPEGGS
jgi:hypothetical protein